MLKKYVEIIWHISSYHYTIWWDVKLGLISVGSNMYIKIT